MLVISLDFELFWGVTDSRTIARYRANVEGEWDAIPRLLGLFREHGIRATWATVGMLMCRHHSHWRETWPSVLPGYVRHRCSTYALDAPAREYPRLFFARPLVEQILATPGQELGTHTYSHFFCGEEGVTPAQFAADLASAQSVAADMGVQFRSLVFPRNQVREDFLAELPKAGIRVYRGNPDHWVYRDGHFAPGGIVGRAVRFADAWLPLTGAHVCCAASSGAVVNVPASFFLRPWSRRTAMAEPVRLARLKHAMTRAAQAGGICHLWWHSHNFGVDLEQNLALLRLLLEHYSSLRDEYGMRSACIGDFSLPAQL